MGWPPNKLKQWLTTSERDTDWWVPARALSPRLICKLSGEKLRPTPLIYLSLYVLTYISPRLVVRETLAYNDCVAGSDLSFSREFDIFSRIFSS